MVMAVVIVQSAPHESKSSEMPYLPPVESPPEVIFYTYTPTDSGYNYRWDNEIGFVLLFFVTLSLPFKFSAMFINLAFSWAIPFIVRKHLKLKIKERHKKKPL